MDIIYLFYKLYCKDLHPWVKHVVTPLTHLVAPPKHLSHCLPLFYHCVHVFLMHAPSFVCLLHAHAFPIVYLLLCTSHCLLLWGRLLCQPPLYLILTLGSHRLGRIFGSLWSTASLLLSTSPFPYAVRHWHSWISESPRSATLGLSSFPCCATGTAGYLRARGVLLSALLLSPVPCATGTAGYLRACGVLSSALLFLQATR